MVGRCLRVKFGVKSKVRIKIYSSQCINTSRSVAAGDIVLRAATRDLAGVDRNVRADIDPVERPPLEVWQTKRGGMDQIVAPAGADTAAAPKKRLGTAPVSPWLTSAMSSIASAVGGTMSAPVEAMDQLSIAI